MKKALLLTAIFGGLCFAEEIKLKADPLGTLKLSGALTVYGTYTNNKILPDEKKTSYDVGSALLKIEKPAEPFGFTLIGGAYAVPVLGLPFANTSTTTDPFSALPVAYGEYTLMKDVSIQAGKLPTIIGYESAFTYQNNYIQRGLVWNMQPVVHHGVRLNYNLKPIVVKLGINDGFYTLSTTSAKPAIEGSVSYKLSDDNAFSFNFILPSKSSKPNVTASPTNKRELNLLATYKVDKTSIGVDLMYVEAPKDDEAGVIAKAKASGAALHLSYELDSYKISGRVEYVKDDEDDGGSDLVGLGDGNKGWTLTVTPSYKKGILFARGEISFVNANDPFTAKDKKSQMKAGVEVGFLF
ncbi:MAG: porin [Aquificaceae bacterium]|nr:porin [Aquificaceae bacterium]